MGELGSGAAGGARKPRATPWRDNLEALTMAVVVALVLKAFVVEAYKIPSGSMQPTLMGDPRSGVHDRILVDKLSYRLRDPERFEVVVFQYPLDLSKTFVKRIVGVGPEELRIAHGDLWRRDGPQDAWEILRRPRAVQEEAWLRLDRLEPEETRWSQTSGDGWELDGRRIAAPGPGAARFAADEGAILDGYLDGYPDPLLDRVERRPGGGQNLVSDLKVAFEVAAEEDCVWVGVSLREGVRRHRFLVPGPAAPPDARPWIASTVEGRWSVEEPALRAQAAEPARLVAGEAVRVAAWNLDDRCELALGGEVVCALDVPPGLDRRASATVELDGGGAVLEDLMVWRDVHYLPGDRSEYVVPAGEYFVLGDNTQDSSDGRAWRLGRFELPLEDGGVLRVEGGVRGDDDPWGANPLRTRDLVGPLARVRDRLGEDHWVRGTLGHPRVEPARTVPRRLVRGRALAVFWPVLPRLGVVRWKWIR